MALFPNGTTNPLEIYFSCTGAERSLMDCQRSELQNDVGCSRVAGVVCPSEYCNIIK